MHLIEKLYKIFLQKRSVSIDTRSLTKGDIFFALKGPNFNGNKYAEQALEKGAAAAVIDEPGFQKNEKYFLAPDVLKALQDLAQHHRAQMNIPVIAIAGSNGKTTTKELITAALSQKFNVVATKGNLNNEIGVPLTLLRLNEKTELAVIEMGAKHRGDIRFLCDIANPTHGIITNTGKDHLETFKTLENTLKTNAELYDHLKKNGGTAFVNSSDADLISASSSLEKRITYGEKNADVKGELKEFFPFLKIDFQNEKISGQLETQLIGKYNLPNVMAAVAIGIHFDVSAEKIKVAIENYVPGNNRSQLLKIGSNTFILDAYNANPTSMMEALKNFSAIKAENKIVILGDMLELGDASFQEHLEIANYLQQQNFHKIVLVGKEFEKVKDKVGCGHFQNSKEVRNWLKHQNLENSIFLLKGSRLLELEKVLEPERSAL